MKKVTLLFAITILLVGCAPDDQPATETSDAPPADDANYVLTNGKVYTVNEKQPWAESLWCSHHIPVTHRGAFGPSDRHRRLPKV